MPYLRVYALLACVVASSGCGLLVRLMPCEGCDAGPVEPGDGGSVTPADAGDDAGETPSDGGELPSDAGEQPSDGGALVDAGPADDAGGDLDGGPQDAGVTDGGDVVPACGTTAAVRDDFDDGVRGPFWFESVGSGMAVSEAGGQLAIELTSGGTRYSYYKSTVGTSLLGGSLSVRVVEVPNAVASTDMRLSFGPDDDNYVEFIVSGGQLMASVVVDAQATAAGTPQPFSSNAHRYWRIVEDGSLSFEVSPNGANWNTFASGQTPPFAHRGYVQLEAGTWESTSSPGVAIFDDLNVGVDVPFCSASTLFDTFDGTTLSPLWERWEYNDPDCVIDVDGGALTVSSPQVSPDCEVYSFYGYALDEEGLTVELSEVPLSSRIVAGLLITDASGLYVEHFLSSNWIAAYVDDGVSSSTYDGIERGSHDWLRVRRDGPVLMFEASPDGTFWSPVAQRTTTVSTDAVTISLRLGYDEEEFGPSGSAAFSGINPAP